MATKYEGLTTAQWASRIVEYNPGKFDKSKLIKHYTAQQLGKFQEGGNIQLAKGIKAKTPAKTQKAPKDDAIKFFKSIKKTPSAPARGPRTAGKLEIEKFLRQVAHENGIKINFDSCPGGGCKKKQPASKKKPVDDDMYSDDSDLESCDEDDE